MLRGYVPVIAVVASEESAPGGFVSHLSIKARLVFILSLILLVAFVVTSVVNYNVSREAVRTELITSSLPLTRDTLHSELRAELMRPLFVSSLMASDTFLRDWALTGEQDVAQVAKYLNEIRTRYGFFTAFFISDESKRYYYHSGILKKISRMDLHDVWFYEFVGRGVEYDLDIDTNQAAENQLTLFINHRVEDYAGYLLGVAGVGLDLDRFAGLISGFQDKYSRRITLVDQFGTVQVSSDTAQAEQVSIHDLPGISSISQQIVQVRGEPANFEYEGEHGNVLLTARHMPDIGWTLLVEQDEEAALATARGNLVRTLVVGVAAWLVIVGISVWTVNHFQRKLVHMAVTDQLTGAANRWEFEQRFRAAQSRLQRRAQPFSVILLDLDRFKEVNDTLGHLAGDKVLTGVVDIVRGMIRPTDLLARWGGDEFIVLLEGGEQDAQAMAERIRSAVAEQCFGEDGCEANVTVSLGVAEYREGESLDDLTRRADSAVYKAKSGGRDCVDTA